MIVDQAALTTDEVNASRRQFLADVLHGLRGRPKMLPSKYFYDDLGSDLFEQITLLDEYYLTRTELAIMEKHAAEMADLVGPRALLIEYGSGSSTKTRLLLDKLRAPACYMPIDLAGEQLARSARALAEDYSGLEVLPICADFTRPFDLTLPPKPSARPVVYFPGSTIGNFTPSESIELLSQTARLCGRGGGLLLGADLRKDPRIIEAAYNDAQGVTAAFNRNLLIRINRELEGDFVIDAFAHRSFYDADEGRIEMHLVSQCAQRVHVGGAELSFAQGESIRTEYSYKYSLEGLRDIAAAAAFEVRKVWTDPRDYFAVLYLLSEPRL